MLPPDTYRHQGLRRQLLNELREGGVTQASVHEAMNAVPRHYFMDGAFVEFAYENKAFQIGAGQTISQPFTVGFQSQLLDITPGQKVLEIGTGSGYQTSVLCKMGAKVFSIERQKLLHDRAKTILSQLNLRPTLVYGDGFKGLPGFAPFDKVLITCGAPHIPEELLKQLKVGGKMVIPLGEGSVQEMTEIIKLGENEYGRKTHGNFSFVPMLTSREYKE
ncbi:MAG: protein-L-isoaspartate(D-aspartate) O-methyltransferase [Flavobacteriales bacterium]